MASSRMLKNALAVAALLAAALLPGCPAESGRLPARPLKIVKADGTAAELRAEIADDDRERERGLMHRKTLGDGEGMLFVFESDRRLSFWMKNTLVPLSIAFIASDGRITEIRDMEPLSLSAVESERSVRYALEAPRGWFGRAGVSAGDRLELPLR